MAGDAVTFSTTVQQYASEHNMSAEQAIKVLGLPQNVNQYQIFTFEQIPEGGYRTVNSKLDVFQRENGQRTQDLENESSSDDPDIELTKYRNDKRKKMQQAGFFGKIGIALQVSFEHPTQLIPILFE